MSIVNNRGLKYSNAARAAIKTAITSHSDWNTWRAARASQLGVDLKEFHSGSLSMDEIFNACDAMGIDALSVANNAGHKATMGGNAPQAKPQTKPAQGFNDWDNPQPASEGAGDKSEGEDMDEATSATGGDAGFVGRDVAELISHALSPVEGLIADRKLAELRALVAPLAMAAAKPVEIVRETVKLVETSALSVQAAAQSVKVGDKSARQVFGFSKSEGGKDFRTALDNTRIALYSSAQAPAVNSDFIWTPELAAILSAADAKRKNILLYGPAGTGKTTASMQYAARTGRPFMRIAFDRTDRKSVV